MDAYEMIWIPGISKEEKEAWVDFFFSLYHQKIKRKKCFIFNELSNTMYIPEK